MSNLPSTLWGAINRAKLDIRKYHLEENPKKKEKMKKNAILAMENADKVVGPGPFKYISTRQNWRNEVLYLNYYEDDRSVGRYWEDDCVQWSLDKIPIWAENPDLKVQEPKSGSKYLVRYKEFVYGIRPEVVGR
jgi:hypothetical protein